MLCRRMMYASGVVLISAVGLSTSSNTLAATVGSAYITVVDPAREHGRAELEFTLPPDATERQTPLASLARRSDHGSSKVDAIVGVDIPAGAISAWGSGRAGSSGLGSSDQHHVFTENHVQFSDNVQIASSTLPLGTPVDVELQYLVAWSTIVGASGEPAAGLSLTYSRVMLQAGSATGFWSNFGGEGQEMLSPITVHRTVGDSLYLVFDLFMQTRADAIANIDSEGMLFPAHADAVMTTALVFGYDIVVPAAPAKLLGTAADQLGDAYLFSPALGGPLPGLEALEPDNIAAHLLPLTPVPETSTLLLGALAGVGILLLMRTRSAAKLIKTVRFGQELTIPEDIRHRTAAFSVAAVRVFFRAGKAGRPKKRVRLCAD